MTSAELIPATLLKRKAVVYVRQSTQSQVMTNLESQRRQYDLVDVARQRGFVDIEVIDNDLGRSASGTVARPGFDRLVAWLCAGKVGAVLCFDASRLARNGRDWHHLLELCGLVEARVIDLDGVYNPCQPNDRLLLGMKGSISEFELGVLKARMLDAARSKARRGAWRIACGTWRSRCPEDVWPQFKARVQAAYQAPSRAIARELAAGVVTDTTGRIS
jgi:DNA invertase Pin-like site-specific DNA recombinase